MKTANSRWYNSRTFTLAKMNQTTSIIWGWLEISSSKKSQISRSLRVMWCQDTHGTRKLSHGPPYSTRISQIHWLSTRLTGQLQLVIMIQRLTWREKRCRNSIDLSITAWHSPMQPIYLMLSTITSLFMVMTVLKLNSDYGSWIPGMRTVWTKRAGTVWDQTKLSGLDRNIVRLPWTINPKGKDSCLYTFRSVSIWIFTMTMLSLATRVRKSAAVQSIRAYLGHLKNNQLYSGSWQGMITTMIIMAHTKTSLLDSEERRVSVVMDLTLSREELVFLR